MEPLPYLKNITLIVLSVFVLTIMSACGANEPATEQRAALPTAGEIAGNLKKINSEGGNGNYFTYFLSNGYLIQAAATKGDYFVRCEASHHLSTNELSQDQKNQLENLGWLKPQVGDVNYWIMQPIHSDDDIAQLSELFIQTINDVYHSTSVDSVVVHLEE